MRALRVSLGRTLKMVSYFLRAYPGRSVLMVGAMLLAGISEGFGLTLFMPLLGMISSGTPTPESDGFGRLVLVLLQTVGLPLRLDVLLIVLVCAITLKAFFLWLAMKQVGFTVARVTTELRMQMLSAVLNARWSYFVSQPSGLFTNAVSVEALKAATAYRCAASSLSYLLQILIYLAIAIAASWKTALLAALAGIAMVALMYRLIEMARRAGKARNAGNKSLLACLVDALQGIKPIKAMARETHVLSLLDSHAKGLEDAQRKQVVASESLRAFQEPIMIGLLAVGFYTAVSRFDVPFTTLALLVFLFLRVLNYVNSLIFHYQTMSAHETDFWSLRDRIQSAGANHEERRDRLPPDRLSAGIAFEHVTFSYGEREILRSANFTIPAKKFVTVEGLSGVGKTTVADLVIGLLEPEAGAVRVDGVPLASLDVKAWRERIGYVPQEMFLFHDTIYENVSLGDPAVTREVAEDALRQAGMWDVVSALPEGMETPVGERGLKLSGGQRQRVAIARALSRRPMLLILDEVTTALDPATEAALCGTLVGLKGRMTILSISHQPALSRIADVRLVMADGVVSQTTQKGSTTP